MKMFYSEWVSTRKERNDDLLFVCAFLQRCEETYCFMSKDYTHEQFCEMLDLFQNIPTEHFLECVCDQIEIQKYDSSEISQFSDFEKGVIAVPQILEFYPEGINFTELGKKLIGSKENEANRKYGENHASLASLMSLATISRKQRKLVYPTRLGHFLIDYKIGEKEKLLKALILRNNFIQAMIKTAITEVGSYGLLMSGLACSTAKRRRQSIRHLIEFILKDTVYESAYHKIDWTV